MESTRFDLSGQIILIVERSICSLRSKRPALTWLSRARSTTHWPGLASLHSRSQSSTLWNARSYRSWPGRDFTLWSSRQIELSYSPGWLYSGN